MPSFGDTALVLRLRIGQRRPSTGGTPLVYTEVSGVNKLLSVAFAIVGIALASRQSVDGRSFATR
jgi:hypothetical protein